MTTKPQTVAEVPALSEALEAARRLSSGMIDHEGSDTALVVNFILSLSASRADDGWLPIEEAPKDGSIILLGRPEGKSPDGEDISAVSVPGMWVDGEDDAPDSMGHDPGFMDLEYNTFTWGRSFGNDKYRRVGDQPTHFRALPSPPVKPE